MAIIVNSVLLSTSSFTLHFRAELHLVLDHMFFTCPAVRN
jgi:hypothetical protein